jgi:hypothetical protein
VMIGRADAMNNDTSLCPRSRALAIAEFILSPFVLGI